MYESFSVTDEDDIDNNHDSSRRSRGSSSNTRYSCMMVMILGAFLGLSLAFFGHLLVTTSAECSEPCVPGSEDIMNPKAHGTAESPVQEVGGICGFAAIDAVGCLSVVSALLLLTKVTAPNLCVVPRRLFVSIPSAVLLSTQSLRWGCDWDTADRICNYNR
jgi:hypothetical protein